VTWRGILVACLLTLGASQALADNDQDAARHAVETGRALPFERILDRARREHPGRLLEAEIEKEGERLVYELRILAPGGHIGQWRYDARTGEPETSEHHQKAPRRGED
jgi:uncharacterized membrane protein YkoI